MVEWCIQLAAACTCAMHGTPARWSSLPVLLMATFVVSAAGGARQAGKATLLMRLVPATVLASAIWMVVVTVVRADPEDGMALLGGLGALTCGYFLGCAAGDSEARLSRVCSSLALGYSIHALILLSWFIGHAGWSVPELVRFRWDQANLDEAAKFGFGNLGNNAVLAAMLMPLFLASALGKGSASNRALGGIALLLGAGVLGTLQARGAIVAAAMAIVVLMAGLRSWRILALLAACALSVGLAFDADNGQLESNAVRRVVDTLFTADADASVRERAFSIEEGWKIALEHPWAGIGGSAIPISMTYSAPHQWHLHQALEWGLPVAIASVISTIAVFASFLRSAWMAYSIGTPWDRVMVYLSIPATYLLIGSVAGAQWHYGLASVWPALSGLGFGMARAALREGRTPSPMLLCRR